MNSNEKELQLEARRLSEAEEFLKLRRKEFRRFECSKYYSGCIWCGEKIRIGEPIMWAPGAGACHVSCFDEAKPSDVSQVVEGKMKCRDGHVSAPRVTWQPVGAGKALRAECSECGRFIAFLRQNEQNISLVLVA